MKPKAIVSFLWESQFEALRAFLIRHEPLVVILPSGALSPRAQSETVQQSASLVWLESLQHEQLPDRLTLEAANAEKLLQESLLAGQTCGESAHVSAPAMPSPTSQWLNRLECAADLFDVVLLVITEDVTEGPKVAKAWAKSREIPTLQVSNAIAPVDPHTVHKQPTADRLAVSGNCALERYLELGIPRERIVITGNPAWDSYVQLRGAKAECRRQLNARYKLDPALPLLVFGTNAPVSASANPGTDIFTASLSSVLEACRTLAGRGFLVNLVVKGVRSGLEVDEKGCEQARAHAGYDRAHYFYTVNDPAFLAAAADVLVAVDSNYLVEGMLADTPVISLLDARGWLLDPCLEAETGIMEVASKDLASGIGNLLADTAIRNAQVQRARARVLHFNFGAEDGLSAIRVAEEMARSAQQVSRRVKQFVWQQYLDVESADVVHTYHTAGREDLAAMYTNTPRLILDIGCAAGSTASLIKQRFPGSKAWGVELNRAAAALAGARLDRVLVGRIEDFDLEREGMAKGTVDAVLLADVLEHIYNPWDVLVKLRPFLSSTGQMVMSIPNVRNLLLMDEMSKGNWTYASQGLLDVTHIRFFTFKEIMKLCQETGYRVVSTHNAIDGRLDSVLRQEQTAENWNINMDRLTFKDVTREELRELCTLQFYFLVERDPNWNSAAA